MKRFLCLLLSLSVMFSGVVFANEANDTSIQEIIDKYLTDKADMDRVYHYDYVERKNTNTVEESEEIKYKNAVSVVTELGIMSYDSKGKFNEDNIVPYSDFASIIYEMNTGIKSEEVSRLYDAFPQSEFATQHDAAYYLVGILGYDLYDSRYNGDNPRSMNAQKIGLTDGISFVGNKNITRGEFAQMIYNALLTDVLEQVSFGDNSDFEIIEGNNLLKHLYDMQIVFGTVTCQNGFDLYSSDNLEEDEIKIGNALYTIDAEDNLMDNLGYRVVALSKLDSAKKSYTHIKFVMRDMEDETISLGTDDVLGVYDGSLHYIYNGQEKKLGLNKIKRAIVNGQSKTVENLETVLNSFEGEVRLCASEGDSIDSIIVFDYETFKVYGNSLWSEQIMLDDGRTFKEKAYIDVSDDVVKHIYKNGFLSEITSIKVGDIVSVVANPSYTHVIIHASDRTITGSVDEISDDGLVIGGIMYKVSREYEKSRASNSKLPQLKLGTKGTFMLDVGNRIVNYSSDGGEYTLGIMTKIGSEENGFENSYAVRIFTQANKWINFELGEKLVLDGTTLSTEDAYVELTRIAPNVCNAPVRFKANSRNEITFLDTKREASAEAGDHEQISFAASQDVKPNWTRTWLRISFISCKYTMFPGVGTFSIPLDPEDEDEYYYGPFSTASDEVISLNFYNVDEFDTANLIVKTSTMPAADGYTYPVVIEKLYKYVNDDGEISTGIMGYDGAVDTNWGNVKIKTSDSIEEEVAQLKVGDVIRPVMSGTEMVGYQLEVRTSEGEHLKDYTDDLDGEFTKTIGAVVGVDPSRKLVKVECEGDTITYFPLSISLYDTKENKVHAIEFSDIVEGDRIYCRCILLFGRMLIIR